MSGHLLLWALVTSVVGCSTQVQNLATCTSAAFPCGSGCGFCCLCDLDALRCDSLLLIFKLKGFLPTVSWCSVLLVVTMATRWRMYEKQHSEDFAIYHFVALQLLNYCVQCCCSVNILNVYIYLILSGESSRPFFLNLLSVSSMVLPILSLISPSFSLKGKAPLLLSQSSSHLLRSNSLAGRKLTERT